MIAEFYRHRKFAFKWIGIAFVIKLALFIFFAVNFYLNWPKDMITNVIFNASGDTSGYYAPLESLVQGKGYYSYGRMPAMLPIYVPLRLFFSVAWTKTVIIVLQFLTSVVSVYILAKTAKLVFKKDRIFYLTFFIYAFSSFVSIWDNVGYMDSFGTSFLIFSVYFSVQYKITSKWKYLFYSGFFIAWSIFFRQLHGLVIPLTLLYLVDLRNIKKTVTAGFIYCSVLILSTSVWAYKNYKDFGKPVFLTGSLTECFPNMITEELLNIRELITVWGGDTQPWVKGSDAEWFFSRKVDSDHTKPDTKNIYTKEYTIDSLRNLKSMYLTVKSDTSVGEETKVLLKAKINEAAKRYTASYKQEHFFRAYVINKLIITRRFVLPPRLDDIPFPALNKMNFVQKAVKGGYYLFLLFVNIFGILGALLALRRHTFLASIPLAFIFVLTFVFGFVEQRYLVPAYCFLVIFVAYVMDKGYEFYLARFKKANK
ncbi:MAG: hypothetical protein K0S33_3555 [Bacteroidetes bacterium]|jgi:hypothetical protein|nr:hypothetical protein [Bacteroidota bacterium]